VAPLVGRIEPIADEIEAQRPAPVPNNFS
jgi:hypothetical protein